MSKILQIGYDGKNRVVEAKDDGLLKDITIEKPATGEKRSFKKWDKAAKTYFRFLIDNHNP